MRVLMLSKACIVGIYQRKLEEMAKLENVHLRVLVPPFWRDERGTTALERAYIEGYELCVTPMRFNGNFHLHYYPHFATHVREFQPDIIHIDEEPYNLATWLALRASNRYSKAKTLFFSWQNLIRNYPPPFSWFEKKTLKTVDHALMGTQSAAKVWQEKGYQGGMTVVPQFGADPDLFKPRLRPDPNKPITIGYVGRLVSEKGIDILLRAVYQLQDLPWKLEIVGSGPELEALQKLVQELTLEARVCFIGWMPSVELPHLYERLDIVVIPSQTRPNWKEQFGRVIIEAMASEVVVIGSDSGAIPDVIGDGGIIFPEGNTEALATQIRQLILDYDKRIDLAGRGRQRVLNHFTQAQVAKQTVEVYQSLLR
jgi:glycosyltransferase involved in cell wall biosynthesis